MSVHIEDITVATRDWVNRNRGRINNPHNLDGLVFNIVVAAHRVADDVIDPTSFVNGEVNEDGTVERDNAVDVLETYVDVMAGLEVTFDGDVEPAVAADPDDYVNLFRDNVDEFEKALADQGGLSSCVGLQDAIETAGLAWMNEKTHESLTDFVENVLPDIVDDLDDELYG